MDGESVSSQKAFLTIMTGWPEYFFSNEIHKIEEVQIKFDLRGGDRRSASQTTAGSRIPSIRRRAGVDEASTKRFLWTQPGGDRTRRSRAENAGERRCRSATTG